MEHKPDNNELLYIGKDDNLSSVYIVSKKFTQENDKFWVTVRFVLLELSQFNQNIRHFLKDHDCEYENLAFVEELWEFEPRKNRYSRISTSYKGQDGKMIYDLEYDNLQWIPLTNVSRTGIVKQVFEAAMTRLVDADELKPGLNIETTNSEGSDVTEIESFNFIARVTKKVKNNETEVHVCVDQIDPVNKKFKKFAYIFLRNGNLRDDLDWGDGENYDRVAWRSFHNKDDADRYLEELKQYLMKLEGGIKGRPINEGEFIKTYTSKDMPKTVMETPSSRAPVGTLKPYKLFKSPTGSIDAVKQGWSWPAFACTPVWPFVKGLNEIGAGILIGYILAVIFDSHEIGIFLDIAIMGIHIWLGVKGNELRENNLRKKGYELVKTIHAETPEGAIASFLKEQKAGTAN